MSEIKVNSIKGVGASAAAITVNNTDGTCTANLTNRTNKNLIINGAMQVAQRGTSNTTNNYGTVDRFRISYSNTDEDITQSQINVSSGTTPYTLGFRKAYKLTNGNQTSGAGADDSVYLRQRIEAQNIANSGWNYNSSSSFLSLQFWIKSSVAQDFNGHLRSRDGTEQIFPFQTGSLTADTWTKVTKTIAGNSNLTFENDNGNGLDFVLFGFRGTNSTDNSATNDVWQAYSSGIFGGKDQTSTWYTTNDATLEITGVQLEVGSVATDFEHRSFGQELALCQRYFFAIPYGSSSNNTQFISSIDTFAKSATELRAQVHFPVPMREAASYTGSATNIEFNTDNSSDYFNANGFSNYLTITGENSYGMSLRKTDAVSMTTGQPGHLIFRATGGFLQFSAEL